MQREILDKKNCYIFYCALINIFIGLISGLKYNIFLYIFIIYKLINYVIIKDKIKKRNTIIDMIEFFMGYITGIGLPLVMKNYKKLF
jgi:hypothetical protein